MIVFETQWEHTEVPNDFWNLLKIKQGDARLVLNQAHAS
jgi:hypothetical protein